MPQRFASFREFWPFYVSQHLDPRCRLWHVAGTTFGALCAVAFLLTGSLRLIPIGIVIGYACAWTGHFRYERNQPAAFTYPLWSFLADWVMWAKTWTGTMENEVKRFGSGESGESKR